MTKKKTRYATGLLFALALALAVPQMSLRAETSDDESEDAGCSAKASCTKKKPTDPDTNVSCTGKKSCTSGLGYVECDGKRTDCPA